jgi:hypothetical protein
MINYHNIGNITLVSGDTYAVREVIKAHGGRWNGPSKVWEIPSGKVAALEIAINRANPARPAAKSAAKLASLSSRPAYGTQRGPYVGGTSGTCRTRGCGNQAVVGGRCRSCGHDEI